MKKIGGCYVDENGNKWSENLFSEEKAIKLSETMAGCRECIDCEDCRDCSFCTNCTNCVDCINCINCINCVTCDACRDCDACKECVNCDLCRECRDCIHCRYSYDCIDCFSWADCSTCSNCNTCTDCNNCIKCFACIYCTGFKENPKHIIGESLDGYNDTPIAQWVEAGKEQCVVGYFRGTLDQLWDEVEITHADDPQYIADCKKFIKAVKAYQEMMK